MSKFSRKIDRRDFLKGAGATAMGAAAMSVVSTAAAAEATEQMNGIWNTFKQS